MYGGGGIFPDVLVDAQPGVPLWYSRVTEQLLPITWAGGYATAATSLGTLGAFVHAPVLPEAAVSDFRTYAKNQGVEIPADSSSNAMLARLLTRAVANSKWGEVGLYSVTAVLDSEVAGAKKEFAPGGGADAEKTRLERRGDDFDPGRRVRRWNAERRNSTRGGVRRRNRRCGRNEGSGGAENLDGICAGGAQRGDNTHAERDSEEYELGEDE